MTQQASVVPGRIPTLVGAASRINGTGLMADLVRAHDWCTTPLGPIAEWPQALLTVVNFLLTAPFAGTVYWGSEMLLIYNDAYSPLLGERHPAALGQPLRDVWAEVWPGIGPAFVDILQSGKTIHEEEVLLPIIVGGQLQDFYWKYSASPIFDDENIVGIFNLAQDVTEPVLNRRRLRTVSEQLNQTLEVTTDGVLRLDRDWKITYLNGTARRIVAPSGEVLGTNVWEMFPGQIYEGSPFVEHYYRAMDEQIAGEFEAYYPEPLNIWIEVQVRPAPDGIVLFFKDVTEQKHEAAARHAAMTKLRSEQERFRQLSDHSPVGIYQADLQGTVHYVNQRTQQMFGLSEQEIAGSGWLSRVHPDDVQDLIEGWKKANAQGEYFEHIYRVMQPGKDVQFIFGRSAVLTDDAGRATGTVGTVEDITERRLAQEALQESQARLNAMYATSLEYIGLLTPEGVILDCNQAWLEFADNTREEVIGLNLWESPWFHWTPGASSDIQQALATVVKGSLIRREVSLQRPSGEVMTFDFSLTPVVDESGQVIFIVPEGRDVTQLKQTESALLQNEKLAAVGRLAASIAHEINNPLESVTNLLYLARGSMDLADIHTYLETAERELRRVSLISNQTLRFHRQSSKPKAVTSDDLFDSVISIYQGRLVNSLVHVDKMKQSNTPISCFDGEIRQVLNNLVGNAIDAIPPEGGRLLLRSREGTHWPSSTKGLVFTIADTGIGIPGTIQTRIYDAFFTTKGIGGTGLGLWVSKEIVARHGGVLRVRSSQQKSASGTVFTLFLPFQAVSR